MEMRTLGRTRLEVSRLGAGSSEIGYELTRSDEATAADILNSALDAGINFLDTSACYDISEELIGRAISHRRDEFVLASKCGHVSGDYNGRDWTVETVRHSIDRSLRRLKTDIIDIMQLHSCDLEVLERGEVIQVLQEAQQAGKIRFIGYSGDNEAAKWAVESGIFDTLQTSFNLVDQQARTKGLLRQAKAQNMGVIIKRPIANGAWGVAKSPSGYATQYFNRAQIMQKMGPLPGAPDNRILLALGFTLAHDEVDTVIVGTRNPEHMRSNIAWFNNDLPISPQVVEELRRRFDEVGEEWMQLR